MPNTSYDPYQASNVYGAIPYNAQPMNSSYNPQSYGAFN